MRISANVAILEGRLWVLVHSKVSFPPEGITLNWLLVYNAGGDLCQGIIAVWPVSLRRAAPRRTQPMKYAGSRRHQIS